MLIGFEYKDGGTIEILPSIDMIQTQKQKRKLFFRMLNHTLSKNIKIQDIDVSKNILDNIIKNVQKHISSMTSKNKITKFFINDTILINNFMSIINNKMSSQVMSSNHFDTDIAKLIYTFCDGSKIEYLQDVQKIFVNYVYENIKLKNKSENIYTKNNYIVIDNGRFKTKVYPIWKQINANEINKIKTEILSSIDEINTTDIRQIYLVYPKNSNFTKHLLINTDDLRGKLKVIPYSFRQLLKSA